MRPIIIINFKTYPSATGKNAVKLAKICEEVAKRKRIDLRVCVQTADISQVANAVKIPVYAQHIDPLMPGRNTGFILSESVKAAGAKGTLINHSEHRIKDVKGAIARAKASKLKTIVCAKNPTEAALLSRLKPDFVAVEPPLLIGGTVSVSSAKPSLISRSVKRAKVPVLVGAGVHNSEDVMTALRLGAKGVLVASAVAKSRNPKKALLNLIP